MSQETRQRPNNVVTLRDHPATTHQRNELRALLLAEGSDIAGVNDMMIGMTVGEGRELIESLKRARAWRRHETSPDDVS